MAKRFYQMIYERTDEPAYLEDLGNILKLSGVVISGMDSYIGLVLPNTDEIGDVEWVSPTLEEWREILDRSDDPVYFERDETGAIKAMHRRSQRVVSGLVQQKIWVRDNYECFLCKKKMGEVSLTVDHFMPLELGGENNVNNYLTLSRKANKDKGSEHPEPWCERNGLVYEDVLRYIKMQNIVHGLRGDGN